MAASEAYVIDAVRTATGKKGGALSGYHPIDLGVEAYRGIFARNDVDPAAFDDVIVDRVEGREVPDRVIDIGFSIVERQSS